MVKLKLGAIKQSSETTQKSPKVAPVATPETTPTVSQKPTETSSVSSAKKTAVNTSPSPTTQVQTSTVAQKTQATTPPKPASPQATQPWSKMKLSGIKKVDPAKAKAKADSEKAAVAIKQEPEIFPIWASCELKNIELFPAYTSKFKKKQGSLLQEIKKLKRLPKTNKIFVITLLWATIGWIALLFILAPEKHNLNYYKTSLIGAYENLTAEKPVEVIPEPIEDIDNVSPQEDIDTLIDDSQDNTIEDNNEETWENTEIIRDIEYYRSIKAQILGQSLQNDTPTWNSWSTNIDEDTSEITWEDVISNNENDEDVIETEANIPQIEDISNSWFIQDSENEENNFEEFEDSLQGWPDEFLD